MGFPGGSDGKESAWNAGGLVSIPGQRKSPGEGNGYPGILSILAWRIPWTVHIYVWLCSFSVHPKLSQHCLLISYTPIQNKKFREGKNTANF